MLKFCPFSSLDLKNEARGDGMQWKLEHHLSFVYDGSFAANVLQKKSFMLFTLMRKKSLQVVCSEREQSKYADGESFFFIKRRRIFNDPYRPTMFIAVVVVLSLIVRAVTKRTLAWGSVDDMKAASSSFQRTLARGGKEG